MTSPSDTSAAHAETRRVVHDLRQPLAAMQMWVDLLGEAQAGRAGEREERYLAKIRAEVKRMTALLASVGSSHSALPRGEVPLPEAAAQPEGGQTLAGLSILVVEDDEMTAEALQLMLEGEGASVALASTLAQGLELLRERQPDAVLSDLRVSDGDGFALVAEVRRLDQTDSRRTVAIAVTGFDNQETRVATRAAGFDEMVTKPFAIDDLIATVARLARPR
jgi:CheY-like chemotaxis protein